MSGNCELGRGLRRRKKNATEAGAGRFEKPALDARAAPPEAHESLISRKTVEDVPLTGLSLRRRQRQGGRRRCDVRGFARLPLNVAGDVGEVDGQGRSREPFPDEPAAIARLAPTVAVAEATLSGWSPGGLRRPGESG